MVGFETIHFIQEVASDHRADQRVDVLKDKKARRHATSHGEDLANAIFGSRIAVKCLHIK